jgi:SSS family solute:Na+ symporter/sodium/pantothenate symporter
MSFMPLVTALFAVTIGVIGAANIPGMEGSQTDRILTVICREVQLGSATGYWIVVVVFSAILAALMSTADSCLLTISSMATKDVYQRFMNPAATEEQLTRIGKILSWVIVALMAALAIWINSLETKPTLVKLLDMKFDMLIQLVPGFMIGIHWTRLRGRFVLLGMVAGLVVTFAFYGSETIRATGFHHGLFGLAVNLLVSVGGSWLRDREEV